MSEVRVAVQHALDKLINRFGQPSEIIAELRRALELMDQEEAPASSRGTDVAPVEVSEPEIQPPAPSTPKKQAKKTAEPRPRARKSTGRKK